MTHNKRILLFILLFCSLMAHGQKLSYDGKGITLMVSPETVCLEGDVTISGASAPGRNNRFMTATFKPPQGPAFTRRFAMKPDGTYTYTETALTITGTWKVSVKGPVIKETASGTFEVILPSAAAIASMGTLQEGLEKNLELLTEMRNQTARFPKLAQKEQADARMEELDNTFNEINTALGEVSTALERINGVMDALAPFPGTRAVMGELAGKLQTHSSEMQNINRELELTYEETNNAREWCRMWYA